MLPFSTEPRVSSTEPQIQVLDTRPERILARLFDPVNKKLGVVSNYLFRPAHVGPRPAALSVVLLGGERECGARIADTYPGTTLLLGV